MGERSRRIRNNIPSEINQFFTGVGKTLLVKGNPGVGKTIFSLATLENIGEAKNGVYVSTRVEIDSLYDQFPWILEMVSEHNIIDVTQMNFSNVSDFLKSVYKKIIDIDLDYPIVVIDSWGPITFDSDKDSKKIEHEISSFARKTAANIILVSEYPRRSKLDYLVDGVVTLKNVDIHGEAHFGNVWDGSLETRSSREICIEKLRGTHINQKKYVYSLYQGKFQYFEPFLPKNIELVSKKIEDPDKTTISSGNRDFDKILGGGFYRGSFNLLEMEHGIDQRYIHLLNSILSNAILGGKRLVLFPIGGKEINNLKKMLLTSHKTKDILVVEEYSSKKENTISFDGNLDEAVKKVFEIREKQPKKLFVYIIGLDLFEYYMGHETAIKKLRDLIERILFDGDILLGIVKRPQQIIDIVSHIADRHFVFKDLNGSLCMYGMRPKTVIYNMSLSDEKLIFTPIV